MRGLLRRAAVLAGAAAVMLGTGTRVAAAQPPVPHLTISGEHHFEATAGESVSHVFRLTNRGGSATGNLTITVRPSPPFTVTPLTCRGALPPGQSCEVRVQFTAPAEPGTVDGTLTAAGARPGVEATAHLTGTSTAVTAACQVENTNSGRIDDSLQAAVNATASAPFTPLLSVSGTCTGTTVVAGERHLIISGQPGATLDGEELGIVLSITGGAHVTLITLKITGGRGAFGGGIRVEEDSAVTLTGSTVTGNTATFAGGGIYNFFGTVTLNGSTITENTAHFAGGGIFNLSGTVTLNGSTITGNEPDNCAPPVSGCTG